MNIENIKVLAEVMNDYGLTRLEIEENETKIRLEKGTSAAPSPAVVPPLIQNITMDEQSVDFNRLVEIKSPMIGIFYSAPSPDLESFVNIGSKVKKGDVLCIIESMKLMNEIPAEQDGEIVDICVKNGDIVEFGQVLFKIF